MSFTHLQVKSSYSLMQSTIKVSELVEKAKEIGLSAIALTDHNVLHGAVEFYKETKSHGIKPIIGMTADVQSLYYPSSSYEVTFLAKNKQGYQELIQLSTTIQLSKESLSKQTIENLSDQVIAIIPTSNKEISYLIKQNNREELQTIFNLFKEAYYGFYPSQTSEEINLAVPLFNEMNLPIIALSDVRALEDDSMTLDILEHIKLNETLQLDTNARIDYSLRNPETDELFFKENNLEEALENNKKVVDMINWELTLGDTQLPHFEIPKGDTTDSYLRKLCLKGLKRYHLDDNQDYLDRLDKELTVISNMGYSDYFLIVWDVMKYAHDNKIETGFGRGSAAASLVAYLLRITDVDPLEYDLLFERFLNKDRYTMPDIDLDFPDNKRHLILNYVLEKYGQEHVAQIMTISTFAAKSSVRETLRVMGASSDTMKRWSNAIPTQANITLSEAYQSSQPLREIVKESKENERIFERARIIEGLPRNYSTHAAGVVMSKEPLMNNVPLQPGAGDILNTQFTMDDVEAIGLLKMDFLSLKNLTVLSNCFKYSQFEKEQSVTKNTIPINDPKTLELFVKGDTNGVFQFEKQGIKQVLRRMKPSSIEDIIATNALYRPGPMKQIDSYIKRKHGQEPITYPHKDLKSILEPTYGIMVYQEQVMQVATKLAGYTLSEADQLRRTMSKKIQSEMDRGRQKFVSGALNKGYSEKIALKVYDYIARFANYGFNRAHAVVYSMLAYHLGYFKTHFPKSFYAAVMTADWGNRAKIKVYETEIRKRQINVLSPDINKSFRGFTVNKDGIQFGFKSISGISEAFIKNIISVRTKGGPFESLTDFCERIDEAYLSFELIESLIKVGAFDQIGYNRRSMVESLNDLIPSIEKSGGNIELFQMLKPGESKIDDYTREELIDFEQSLTGFYFTGHPMSQFTPLRNQYNTTMIAELPTGNNHILIGKIESIRKIQTKTNQPMAFVSVSDESGDLDLVVFPNVYIKYLKILDKGRILLVKGKIEYKNNKKQMIVAELADATVLTKQTKSSKTLYLRFKTLNNDNNKMHQVRDLLSNQPGEIPVVFYSQKDNEYKKQESKYNFNENGILFNQIKEILGKDNCVLK